MEDKTNELVEQTLNVNEALEALKQKLNPYLKDYLKQRIEDKNTFYENYLKPEGKKIFLSQFNQLSTKEKIDYKNYVSELIANPANLKDDDDLRKYLESLSSMEKAEIKAGLYNNIGLNTNSLTNIQEQYLPNSEVFVNSTFFIPWWEIKKQDWTNFQVWNLSSEYLWNWGYELFLWDLWLEKEFKFSTKTTGEIPTSLIITKNEIGWFDIFSKDKKELPAILEQRNLKAKNWKLTFDVKRVWLEISLDIQNAK